MRASIGSLSLSRLAAAAVAALCLLCAGQPAKAGGGASGDQPLARSFLDSICSALGMTPAQCPQVPAATQVFLEISGLLNSPPDDVRNIYGLPPAFCGNLGFPGSPCPTVAVNAVNAPVKSPPAGPLDIAYLTPLAFIPGTTFPTVTQYGDPTAKRFLYAALIEGSDGQPQALDLVLDDTLGTNKQFSKGPVVAFSLPLVVLQSGTETPVAATLQLTATCNGANCLSGTVTGVTGSGKSPPSAAQLGIQFSSTFASSPNSATAHQIYELLLPLVVTNSNDPGYFTLNPPLCPNSNGANLLSGYCNAFSKQELGFSASVLGSGSSIGAPPYAAPLCTSATCPSQGTATTTYFGFCAGFPNLAATNVPAVETFLQIGTNGTTSLSTPTSTQGIACPPQS
jgi:hypothetical protein